MDDLPELPDNLPEDRIDDISRRAVSDARPKPLWKEPLVWFIGACIGGMLVFLVAIVVVGKDKYDANTSRIGAFSGALSTANSRISELGGQTVPAPSPGAAGPTGQRGPAPTDVQILTAVDLYCSTHGGCVGVPTRAQVITAVVGYCQAVSTPCVGATGATGSPGASGVPGSDGASGAQGDPGASGPAGPPGPGPTDDQIATAIGLYCDAHNQCEGPSGSPGESGASGAPGANGRGIASIDCQGLTIDQLTIHYDDGTSETVNCTVLDTATPTDTPS